MTGARGPVAGGQADEEHAVAWPPDGPRTMPAVTDATIGEPRAMPFRIVSELSARLGALARLVQIGSARSGADGISRDLLDDADALLARAGQRLRLSSEHTVVALGGGTGSGKSSLFNRLAGADFSTVGVTRPVTREVHACVWGVAGSGSLLEWLGVPRRYRYARASALDSGEDGMNGLVLLDMPDHDSVMAHASDQVDHLVELSDLMVWVLDPQKYADAAVHRRFLVPMAGHAEVIAVVLNQSDMLAPEQVDECVQDLRRLLDSENLQDVQILVTSATTGAGSARCACSPRPSRPAARPPPASPPTWTPSPPGSCPTPGRNRRPMTVPPDLPRPRRRPPPGPVPVLAAAAGPWTAGPPPPSWPHRPAGSPSRSPRRPGCPPSATRSRAPASCAPSTSSAGP